MYTVISIAELFKNAIDILDCQIMKTNSGIVRFGKIFD